MESDNNNILIEFEKKINRRKELAVCIEATLEARSVLKRAEMTVINSNDSKSLGSNDKARDAKIRELTKLQRESLERCEAEERKARLEFEIACDVVECLTWLIRNKEG